MSRWHVAGAFRQETGATPVRLLHERRTARAQTLIENGSLSLAEIAVAVGFKSKVHFTQVFRRLTGTTPGAYRRG